MNHRRSGMELRYHKKMTTISLSIRCVRDSLILHRRQSCGRTGKNPVLEFLAYATMATGWLMSFVGTVNHFWLV